MNAKEVSRPLVAQETGQAVEKSGETDSIFDFTSGGTDRQDPKFQISDILPHGRESALKMRDLKELFSKDSRAIRLMIQRERQHVPILSDNSSGYWISDNEADVRQFTISMRHRARQIWTTAANVERAAGLSRRESQQLEGQRSFFDGGGSD